MSKNELPVNEIFGITIQGEGMEMGRSCFFLRVHHCPVKCPGCDSHWTWDGSEKGRPLPILSDSNNLDSIEADLRGRFAGFPGAGLVVSGGEPLLYHRNEHFRAMLNKLLSERVLAWIGLETSGFAGQQALFTRALPQFGLKDFSDLDKFLSCFTSVHLSPKITPCLHGTGWSDNDLLRSIPSIIASCLNFNVPLALKFVCRDEADTKVVLDFYRALEPDWRRVPIFIMPYGQLPDELRENTERLIPFCAQTGFTLTPRIHSLLWGKTRAR